MLTNKKRILLLITIYLSFIGLGLPDALLGSAWTMVRTEFNIPLSSLGIVSIVGVCTVIISTMVSPYIIKKIGTRNIVLLSTLSTSIFLLLISRSTTFTEIVIYTIPLGFGAGGIDVALNSYVSKNYDDAHMNFLHSFWGVGITIGPFIVSNFIGDDSWRLAYFIVANIIFFIFLIQLITYNTWSKENNEPNVSTISNSNKILSSKGTISSILVILFYCTIESLFITWIASYGYIILKLSKSKSAILTTLFLLSLTVGRIISGLLSIKVNSAKMLKIGLVLISLSSFILLFTNSLTITILGIIISGLGCAPIYPSLMSYNKYIVDESNIDKLMSYQMSIGYLSFAILVPFCGLLFDIIDINLLPFTILLFNILLIIVILNTTKRKNKKI